MAPPFDIARLETLALVAGRTIMAHRAAGFDACGKADGSPVTQADRDAEAIILAGLRANWPDIPCIGEEEVSGGSVLRPEREFFLVDPLDGTREFIAGRDEFTVNIALVRDGTPVAGVVYAPACGELYSAAGGTAWDVGVSSGVATGQRTPLVVSSLPARLRIVASRSHRDPQTDRAVACFTDRELIIAGSSLKFCMIASGRADFYPRFSRTMEWDTAAGDAILRAAGGVTVTSDGQPLLYGKVAQPAEADFANPPFLAGSPVVVERACVVLRQIR